MNSPVFPVRRLFPLASGAKITVNQSYESSIKPAIGAPVLCSWGTLIFNGAGFHVQTLLGVRFYPWQADQVGTLEIYATDFKGV